MKDKPSLIFTFLRYIQPVWYQNLTPSKNNFYWVDYNSLDTDDQTMIDFDVQYTSNLAALRDAAYQAFHKGIMVRRCITGINHSILDERVAVSR
jgi:hypothetical protein